MPNIMVVVMVVVVIVVVVVVVVLVVVVLVVVVLVVVVLVVVVLVVVVLVVVVVAVVVVEVVVVFPDVLTMVDPGDRDCNTPCMVLLASRKTVQSALTGLDLHLQLVWQNSSRNLPYTGLMETSLPTLLVVVLV
jgi:hypothetical protein